jgi:leader peptidase (prepilin peptidase)/N-methyltransferase
MVALFEYIDSSYWLAYFIFFSALIVTIRTDLETMLISRYVTLYAVPVGWLLAGMGYLPISLAQSILGSIAGYMILLLISVTFARIKGKEGMGQGDLELLAFIGSFVGFWGCWITLMIGSTVGALVGIGFLLYQRNKFSIALPFGPFLALGALLFVFLEHYIQLLL